MPVIDWIRTDLQYLCPDGTSSLYYDRIRFAYFDMKILEREGAEKDYTEEELHKVSELDQVITEKEKDDLIDTIIVKTQLCTKILTVTSCEKICVTFFLPLCRFAKNTE